MKNGFIIIMIAIGCGMANAQTRLSPDGQTASFTVPPSARSAILDYAHSKPTDLLIGHFRPEDQVFDNSELNYLTAPVISKGATGTGKPNPVRLHDPTPAPSKQGPLPENFGGGPEFWPFTTAQIDSVSGQYPFQAAGKLFYMTENYQTGNCSAAMIKRGIAVTAAHCIAIYGKNQFYSSWQFYPAYSNGTSPFGAFNASSARVLSAWLNGKDKCTDVVCLDDVGILVFDTNPGAVVGYFGYVANLSGFNKHLQAMISLLGYPANLDSGVFMERTDSQGLKTGKLHNNIVIGTIMAGGASGGPFVLNLGLPPVADNTLPPGNFPNPNVITGVASWGNNDDSLQLGASLFTSANIIKLIQDQCAETPNAC